MLYANALQAFTMQSLCKSLQSNRLLCNLRLLCIALAYGCIATCLQASAMYYQQHSCFSNCLLHQQLLCNYICLLPPCIGHYCFAQHCNLVALQLVVAQCNLALQCSCFASNVSCCKQQQLLCNYICLLLLIQQVVAAQLRMLYQQPCCYRLLSNVSCYQSNSSCYLATPVANISNPGCYYPQIQSVLGVNPNRLNKLEKLRFSESFGTSMSAYVNQNLQ